MTESIDRPTGETAKITALFTSILKEVCEHTEWEYGEVWLPKTETILELSPAWYISSKVNENQQVAWAQFWHCSEKFILRFGEGLPGRVWQTQAYEWIADVSSQSESYFLRDQIARAFGVKAAFGLPVKEGNIQAMLVFFLSKMKTEDPNLISRTVDIITQIKQVSSPEND